MQKMIQSISPINGKLYAERPTLDLKEAKAKIALARQAQSTWAKLPLKQRIEKVMAGIQALEGNRDAIILDLAHQMGRPVRYGGEFGGVRERSEYMAKIAESGLAPLVVEESESFERKIAKEPHGVVFVMAPWNYPYLTAINTIVPALIAGNAVVLKPSSQTLLAGEHLWKAFSQAGLPDHLFQNFYLDHETSEKLIQERQFDFINFTGSVAGGKQIERAAAGTFVPVGLELGGKDAGYVRKDADLDWAVDVLLDGAIFNAGQCCCGIERIYIHQNLYDKFLEKAVAWVYAQKLGNPLLPDTTLGPMANIRFANLVRKQTQEAIKMGATPLIDAKKFPEDTGDSCYLAPQILVNVNHQMSVMMEESFGPVVGIMKVSGDEEAIQLINDSPYGLTASLWSKDSQTCEDIAQQLQVGTVFMNRCDYLDPALCWTGCKDTGRGVSLSVIGYSMLTRPKSYHFRKVKK